MSVFQRRLASSTYALLRSFERRAHKLTKLVEDMRSGRLNQAQLEVSQQTLNEVADVFDEKTADEEETSAGQEENERSEDRLLDGVLATSLAELQAELQQVEMLLDLARQVYAAGEESKFEKLRDILRDPEYQHEKLIIFTEHRDTLDFLVHRLEGMGFTGQIAQIHGGMDYQEREEQVTAFRRPVAEGGALYLVATDAAGEGINLQVCWLMVNYDIPWNPARLEQRMGRIHRYGQKHDKVYILNLVAGNTREGRVMKTVLEKLERIRKELGSDKVFDVIGELFEGVSLREYMAQVMTAASKGSFIVWRWRCGALRAATPASEHGAGDISSTPTGLCTSLSGKSNPAGRHRYRRRPGCALHAATTQVRSYGLAIACIGNLSSCNACCLHCVRAAQSRAGYLPASRRTRL